MNLLRFLAYTEAYEETKMSSHQVLRFGPYRLEGTSGQLWRHTQVVKLPPKATAVLCYLAARAGQVVTKATLLDTVWAGTVVSEGVLTVCIRELRRILGDDAKHPRYIETVHRRGYRFVAFVEPRTAHLPGRSAAPTPAIPFPPPAPGLVGREDEVAQVQACLERARRGQRHMLFISGEAGIGKTTLVEACAQEVTVHGGGWVGWGQCVDTYGPGTGYLPVLEALGRLCRGPMGETVLAQLRQWAPTWLAQLSGVLEAAEQARLQRRTLSTTRERLLQELAAALEALTQAQLGVLVLEDLHWSDPSTVDVLTMLARRREAARLLILGTYRPVELILRAHPLKSAIAELHLHRHCTDLALPYLAEAAVATYVAQHFPVPVVSPVAAVIYQRTAGHPLFMVHLATYLVQQVEREAHAGGAVAARIAAIADTIPAGVQQLIELQLEQLHTDEQRILAMASVAGVEFAVASVAAGMQTSPDLPEAVCEVLAQRGQFLEACGVATWPDGTVSGQYRFRHAVYQQVLYRKVADARRVQGHRRIGARLEAGYGTHTAEIVAALAVHFERGQDAAQAIAYHTQAGQQALERSAYQEAIGHLTTGLVLLATLPETPARAQQEFDLQLTLGPALMVTRGYAAPEVEQTYARARALYQQVGETPQLFAVLRGLWQFYHNQGALQTARALGEQLHRLARRQPDPALHLVAHAALGTTLFFLGDYALARAHLEQGIALNAPEGQRDLAVHYGTAPGVQCRAVAAQALWRLGYPDQALQQSHMACTEAQALEHPPSLALALYYAIRLHIHRREVQATQTQAERLLTLSTVQEFAQRRAAALFLRGWALAMQGYGDEALAQMRQGLTAVLATGQAIIRPIFLTLLSEAYGKMGQSDEALRMLAEARAAMEESGRSDLQAEIDRLQGEVLLQAAADSSRAEICFRQALDSARHQGVKLLELRAAMSLSRLWLSQGKRPEAHALLAPLYNWFTEGFDTADLQEARALLEELA